MEVPLQNKRACDFGTLRTRTPQNSHTSIVHALLFEHGVPILSELFLKSVVNANSAIQFLKMDTKQ